MNEHATKSADAILKETPFWAGVLLAMYERDVHALCDYMTPEEQANHLETVCYALRNRLMIDCCWSHEAATALAESYRMSLQLRLKRPEVYNPALRPRQP